MKLEELICKNLPNFDKFIKIMEVMNAGYEIKTQTGNIFRLAECEDNAFGLVQKVGDNYWIGTDMPLEGIVRNLCDESKGVSNEELKTLIANMSLSGINKEKRRLCNG